MNIAIMGAGGLGGYFGGQLARTGQDVNFIARGAHLAALLSDGLRVISREGSFVVNPVRAAADPAAIGPVDLILFCVKAYDAAQAIEQLKPMVGPQTAIVPVLNGVDHLAALAEALGSHHVLGGLAAITAHRVAPGVIEHIGAPGKLEFGELDGALTARCEAIGHQLARRINVSAVRNVRERLWWKLTVLSGAGLCSVVRADMGVIFNTPKTTALAFQAMSEAVAVAQAQGIALASSLPGELVGELSRLTGDKPSMFVDLEHGRRLEVDALNGAIARYGRQYGIPTPVNDFISACLSPWANGTP